MSRRRSWMVYIKRPLPAEYEPRAHENWVPQTRAFSRSQADAIAETFRARGFEVRVELER